MQEKIKSVYRWFGLGIGIIALAYFLNSALKQISIFPALHWGLGTCASIVATTVLSGLVMLIGGYSWILLLRATGETLTIPKGLVIFTLAQFAKYIPGNVAHHAGRIALASSRGLTVSKVVFSMVIEASWLVVAASVLATAWLFLVGDGLFEYAKELPTLFQLAAGIAAACLFPLLAGWILFYWHPGPLQRILGNRAVKTPSLPILLTCLFIYMLCFLLMGAAADILAQYLFGASGSHILLLTGAFAIAWVAGFLAPGAPAGIGVREAILLKILTPIYGPGIAAGLAISLRAITTLTDGLAFAAALFAKGKMDSGPP
ncbi:MAG TPA: lysylphosphatidylglycerol synthase domain-containing protein [Desulfatiglandales bacterium]|nr:lysylphosphatidylglycerol synthase domain-containing protein [Desulfatiglandales bacterium]